MDLSSLNWPMLILGYPMLLMALSAHECGHAWASDRLGDPTARLLGRVTLNPLAHIDIFGTVLFPIVAFLTGIPLIGWAKPVPVNLNHLRHPLRDNMIVSLAGPASNVLLSILLLGIFAATKHIVIYNNLAMGQKGFALLLLQILAYGVLINAMLAVFNLIPLPPLDGSHVLEYFLPYRHRHLLDAIRPYSFFILMGLFWLGMLNLIMRPLAHLLELLIKLV